MFAAVRDGHGARSGYLWWLAHTVSQSIDIPTVFVLPRLWPAQKNTFSPKFEALAALRHSGGVTDEELAVALDEC